jgi:NADH-quinone oxidoreductase subunit F
VKILLKHINEPGLAEFDTYRKLGGYVAVEKAVTSMTRDQILSEVKKSGLRGRGGAGFPTGMKWSFLARDTGKPSYLVCNADEGEPGTFKDHFLMKKNPHLLIEGIIVASYALEANCAYIYVRGEFYQTIRILEKAIAEAYRNNFLGKNICGKGYHLDIIVHPGAGAYICGEETALLESLEGKRGNPRLKPPFPAVQGLYGCPTIINNVETLASIPWIINNGGETYAKIGIGKSTGTRLISASGFMK